MLLAGSIDLHEALTLLSRERPVFHSEADFQFALAWVVKTMDPEVEIRLERPVDDGRMDLEILKGNSRSGLELKYLVRPATVENRGETFTLRSRAADHARYDVVKDIERLERYVANKPGSNGVVIALASDAGMWTVPSPSDRPRSDAAFRIHEGSVLGGHLTWGPTAGQGSTAGRGELKLGGPYALKWHGYSELPLELRVLTVEIGPHLART